MESSAVHTEYVTERIVNAFLAGAIPVYYGPPEVSKYFNPLAFIDKKT